MPGCLQVHTPCIPVCCVMVTTVTLSPLALLTTVVVTISRPHGAKGAGHLHTHTLQGYDRDKEIPHLTHNNDSVLHTFRGLDRWRVRGTFFFKAFSFRDIWKLGSMSKHVL